MLENKGIVEKGALLKKGGILEDAGLIRKADMTEEQKKKAKNFSLEEHLRPAKEKLAEEASARKKAMAAGKLVKEKEDKDSDPPPAVSSSSKKQAENRIRVVKEVMAKLKKTKELEEKSKSGKSDTDGKKASTSDDLEEDPEQVQYVVARGIKGKKALMDVDEPQKAVMDVNQPQRVLMDPESGKLTKKSAANMEEYFRVRREQAMESAAEEEKRDRNKRSGKLTPKVGVKYRELLTKFGEGRKGVGLQKSVYQLTKDVYKDGGWSPLGPPTETENIDDSTENVSTFRHLLYSSEVVTERPGPDGPGPPAVKYKMALHCISRGTRETKMLELWEVPKTGFEIKVCG